MLKKLALLAALLAVPVLVNAQGTVNFQTTILGLTAQVLDSDGTPLTGTNFWAQLYAADGTTATAGQLHAVGNAVNFRGGVNVGYVQDSGTTARGVVVNKVVTVTDSQGGAASVQIRAWAGTYLTYEDAVAQGGKYGSSNVLPLASTGFPPGTPPNLTGIVGFRLVPEPSTIALGVLGLGSLLLFRRKKA